MFFLSLITYSPNDPNFIYNSDSTKIANAGGFYGSVISDFLLRSKKSDITTVIHDFFYCTVTNPMELIKNNLGS